MTSIPSVLQSPLGPVVVNVVVNGVPYNGLPPVLDAQLYQTYGQHDAFCIRIEYPPQSVGQLNSLVMWPDDTPIQVQWGRVPDIQNWYGYVNHHEINSNADSGTGAVQVTYVCIGTSTVLNPETTRQWEQVSPTYIASQIAAENGLRAVTTPSSQVLTYEAQNGESDFDFLNRIADKTGYRFWVSSGSLYMVSPVVALQGVGSSAIPQYRMDKSMIVTDTCKNFKYVKGKNLPGAVQSNRGLYGIDSSSGKVFTAVSQPSVATTRTNIKTTYASQSYADAQSRVDAWAALSQFWLGATAQLYGATALYPGKLVNISGYAMPENSGGTWLVADVTHNLQMAETVPTQDVYISDCVLIRNTDQQQTVALANTQPVTPEFTTMSLNTNGRWISTNQSVVTLASQ